MTATILVCDTCSFSEEEKIRDGKTGGEIHQMLVELNREQGGTLLVVTHNPELAALMPRRLRMIDGGRLIEEGSEDAAIEGEGDGDGGEAGDGGEPPEAAPEPAPELEDSP